MAFLLATSSRPQRATRDIARLEEVARAAAPAHVAVEVLPVDRPLRAAVASLVGIDTYLAAPEPTRPARPMPGLRQ